MVPASNATAASAPPIAPVFFQLPAECRQVQDISPGVHILADLRAVRDAGVRVILKAERAVLVVAHALQVGTALGPRQGLPFRPGEIEVLAYCVENYPAAERFRGVTGAIPAPGPASGLTTSP